MALDRENVSCRLSSNICSFPPSHTQGNPARRAHVSYRHTLLAQTIPAVLLSTLPALRKVSIFDSSVSSDSMIGISKGFFAGIRLGIRLTPGIRSGIIAVPNPRRIGLVFAVFVATGIIGIIPGYFSQRYLCGLLGVLPACLNVGSHEQRQYLLDTTPQPSGALGPRLVPHHGDAQGLSHTLELAVQLGGGAGVLLFALHELDDGLSDRGAVKRGLILDLHNLVPILEELLGSPTHHLVDARCVLAPVSQPRPSRQFEGRFVSYRLRECVQEGTEELRVFGLEALPQLLLCSALPVRDALELDWQHPVEHVTAVCGDVYAVQGHGPSRLDYHVLIVGVEAPLGVG